MIELALRYMPAGLYLVLKQFSFSYTIHLT
jgi:hypothetical protein